MSTRVPVQHYNLNSPTSFIERPLHVLNTVEGRTSDMDDIAEVDREAVTEDSLDNDNDTGAVDCMHEPVRNSLPLHNVEVEEDRSSLETNESSRGPYDILTIDDVSPIESARARFLQIVVDHFIGDSVIEVADSEADYPAQSGQDKLNKRKSREAQYEGDPNFALPLMYVANMYESLVNDVNIRLASLNGIREKTIGVALEAAGGLYRRLAKKFPKKGPCMYKRRELATSMETRNRFPELVIQEEKRVRFVVVNGLKIVEKPNTMPIDDAEWFKRLTGRNDIAISSREYKFYSPRHKYRRATSNLLPNISGLPSFPGADNSSTLATSQGLRSEIWDAVSLAYLELQDSSQVFELRNHSRDLKQGDQMVTQYFNSLKKLWQELDLFNQLAWKDPADGQQNQQQTPCKHHMQSLPHQPQFHPVHQNHQSMHQIQHAGSYSHSHQCGPPSHLSEVSQAHQSPTISQHLTCLQPLTGGHVGGRLHILPSSPAKFCDECGAPYLRESSKFCSECGSKRLGT